MCTNGTYGGTFLEGSIQDTGFRMRDRRQSKTKDSTFNIQRSTFNVQRKGRRPGGAGAEIPPIGGAGCRGIGQTRKMVTGKRLNFQPAFAKASSVALRAMAD